MTGDYNLTTLILNINLFLALRGVDNGIADDGVAVAIREVRAPRCNRLVVDDGIKEVVEFVNKRMLPADDMALRPPIFPIRMVGLADVDSMEAACLFGFFVRPIDIHLVHALQVEGDRAVLAVDFQRVEVLAPLTEA